MFLDGIIRPHSGLLAPQFAPRNSPQKSLCGRYRLSRRKQIVEEYFDTVSGDEDWGPRYNIAPTQPIPVIRQNPKEPVRELSLIQWGLIPYGRKTRPSPPR
ncbi:MAG: SOS response-associated peptidase family protein [Terriglobales bacterium]